MPITIARSVGGAALAAGGLLLGTALAAHAGAEPAASPSGPELVCRESRCVPSDLADVLGWNADMAGSALDVSYTLLPGWSATELDSGDVILHLPGWVAPGGFGVPAVTIFASPLVPRQPCGDSADPEVGTSPSEIGDALVAQPGLEITVDEPAEIGGLPGRHLDLTLADGWTDTCPAAAGEPAVAYLIDDHGTHLHRTVTAGTPVRLYLLDAGDRTVAVEVAVPASRVDFDQYMEVAQQVIDTLDFTEGN